MKTGSSYFCPLFSRPRTIENTIVVPHSTGYTVKRPTLKIYGGQHHLLRGPISTLETAVGCDRYRASSSQNGNETKMEREKTNQGVENENVATMERWNGMQTERKTRGTKGKESRMRQKMEETVYVYSAGPARRINIQCTLLSSRSEQAGKGSKIWKRWRNMPIHKYKEEEKRLPLTGFHAGEAKSSAGGNPGF